MKINQVYIIGIAVAIAVVGIALILWYALDYQPRSIVDGVTDLGPFPPRPKFSTGSTS